MIWGGAEVVMLTWGVAANTDYNKCNAFGLFPNHLLPPSMEKFFNQTGPWCQKDWELLV